MASPVYREGEARRWWLGHPSVLRPRGGQVAKSDAPHKALIRLFLGAVIWQNYQKPRSPYLLTSEVYCWDAVGIKNPCFDDCHYECQRRYTHIGKWAIKNLNQTAQARTICWKPDSGGWPWRREWLLCTGGGRDRPWRNAHMDVSLLCSCLSPLFPGLLLFPFCSNVPDSKCTLFHDPIVELAFRSVSPYSYER